MKMVALSISLLILAVFVWAGSSSAEQSLKDFYWGPDYRNFCTDPEVQVWAEGPKDRKSPTTTEIKTYLKISVIQDGVMRMLKNDYAYLAYKIEVDKGNIVLKQQPLTSYNLGMNYGIDAYLKKANIIPVMPDGWSLTVARVTFYSEGYKYIIDVPYIYISADGKVHIACYNTLGSKSVSNITPTATPTISAGVPTATPTTIPTATPTSIPTPTSTPNIVVYSNYNIQNLGIDCRVVVRSSQQQVANVGLAWWNEEGQYTTSSSTPTPCASTTATPNPTCNGTPPVPPETPVPQPTPTPPPPPTATPYVPPTATPYVPPTPPPPPTPNPTCSPPPTPIPTPYFKIWGLVEGAERVKININ